MSKQQLKKQNMKIAEKSKIGESLTRDEMKIINGGHLGYGECISVPTDVCFNGCAMTIQDTNFYVCYFCDCQGQM